MEGGAASPQMLSLIIDPKAHHSLFPPDTLPCPSEGPRHWRTLWGMEQKWKKMGLRVQMAPLQPRGPRRWAEGDRTGNMGDRALPRTVSARGWSWSEK